MTSIKLFLLCDLATNRTLIGRWLLAILQLWLVAGTPQIVLLVQRISDLLLRRWNNQGAVREEQQGRGGKSRRPGSHKTLRWSPFQKVAQFGRRNLGHPPFCMKRNITKSQATARG
ncbi:hypothetical protein [Aeromonas salmonicida]|uniref:hypothetical protein n=1 Tax=Aeromonas salmonicida TaxID=645 RepID=UPI0038D4812F